jgi:hypothetical protein
VAIYASKKGELPMTAREAWPMCLAFALIYGIAAYLLQLSMQVSRKLFVQVMNKLNREEKEKGFEIDFEPETRLEGNKAKVWLILQISILAILLCFFLISLKTCPSNVAAVIAGLSSFAT